ncbi:hypothetical protein MJ1HA_0334 [Metallosphaera sedula]|nr:hypothetical protein MJ1HA_0334 [Metallosphaera sedula]
MKYGLIDAGLYSCIMCPDVKAEKLRNLIHCDLNKLRIIEDGSA